MSPDSRTHDPELERFCHWLRGSGHEPCSMTFETLKQVWLKGLMADLADQMKYDGLTTEKWRAASERFGACSHQVRRRDPRFAPCPDTLVHQGPSERGASRA